jgi:long-chain acyl-CoA synthetase
MTSWRARHTARSAADVRQQMLAAADALRALGVQPGDRVAIVGLNSTRYLALDIAIGLVGAVSVPLYYTSPPAEVDLILQASGARLLLIGAPCILERLDELQTKIPVISFCREGSLDELPPSVMSWAEFLALGDTQQDTTHAPVGLGDMATLRYTSGTTGRPKGVIFHHAHLRWMAECIASLLPWRVRNKRGTWLSCLPMSHVVEGILATYAPYYLPTSVDIYFLENLRELPQALRLVRPTAFFSVPRVYEKVWEAFSQSRLGRRYLALPDGPIRRALRPLMRRGILRKAGLDRCAQLIVGSAPVSTDLLRSFREVGIEIHNAYGLTEAPLVTINRVGRNRLGTVGEPLPQTTVRIADDGEVLVRGPQVTAGYYGEQPDTLFRDGWLLTGDLGHLTAEGSLVIYGRAKELLKTSYGKFVHPSKVEGMLRELPGVVEAMLLGEGRPYCVALLWVDEDHRDSAAAARISDGIAQINTRLSHPEQVKRWAILPASLSTERGELTANLKLKRQVVAARFQAVLDALYADTRPPAEVLHVGQAERDG